MEGERGREGQMDKGIGRKLPNNIGAKKVLQSHRKHHWVLRTDEIMMFAAICIVTKSKGEGEEEPVFHQF